MVSASTFSKSRIAQGVTARSQKLKLPKEERFYAKPVSSKIDNSWKGLGRKRERRGSRGSDITDPTQSLAAAISAISSFSLDGTGIGYVDAHVLLSVKLNNVKLWTRDKCLVAQAERLGANYLPIQ